MASDNHRHSERHEGFWKVFLLKDSEEIDLGFLFDISDDGIQLWVHNAMKNIEQHFSIRLYLPEEMRGDHLDLDLELIRKTGLGLSPYIEAGCHFAHLNSEKKALVNKLIQFFDKTKT